MKKKKMVLCAHANAAGSPGKGFHKASLGRTSVGDFLLTLVSAFLLSYIPGFPPAVVLLVGLCIFAVLLHKGLCVRTSVNAWIYGNYLRVWVVGLLLAAGGAVLVSLAYVPGLAKSASSRSRPTV